MFNSNKLQSVFFFLGGARPRGPWGSWERVRERSGEKNRMIEREEESKTERQVCVCVCCLCALAGRVPLRLYCKAIISGGVRDL